MKQVWTSDELAKFFCPKIGPQDMLTKPDFITGKKIRQKVAFLDALGPSKGKPSASRLGLCAQVGVTGRPSDSNGTISYANTHQAFAMASNPSFLVPRQC